MDAEFVARFEALAGLHEELSTSVSSEDWGRAAALAEGLEGDLEVLRSELQAMHRRRVREAHAVRRAGALKKLRQGLSSGRLRRWTRDPIPHPTLRR